MQRWAHYTYGLQRISENQPISGTWTPSFYGYDGGDNVRQLTNAAGTVTDTYEYDAYGNALQTSGSTPNVYLYRAEQYDSDLGLYYLRARYYNPLTGRFMSRDPEDQSARSPNDLHKYLYASGDPINGIDPMGREDLVGFAIRVAKFLVAVPEIEEVVVEGALCLLALGVEVNAYVDGRGTDATDQAGYLAPCGLYFLKTGILLFALTF